MNAKNPLALVTAAAAVGLVAIGLSQNSATGTAQKLQSISCAPECGFMCRSHNEPELLGIVKTHAKKFHGKTLTDEQVRAMLKPANAAD